VTTATEKRPLLRVRLLVGVLAWGVITGGAHRKHDACRFLTPDTILFAVTCGDATCVVRTEDGSRWKVPTAFLAYVPAALAAADAHLEGLK
jgi:hypothetical protein